MRLVKAWGTKSLLLDRCVADAVDRPGGKATQNGHDVTTSLAKVSKTVQMAVMRQVEGATWWKKGNKP